MPATEQKADDTIDIAMVVRVVSLYDLQRKYSFMINASHPLSQLFKFAENMYYPGGVMPILKRVYEPDFFPGGCGLWDVKPRDLWPALPVDGMYGVSVLVLGHNFGSEKFYCGCLESASENRRLIRGSSTWPNLKELLNEAGVCEHRCFLTNFFMGCRPGCKMTGKFPGAKDPNFVAECIKLLRLTVQVVRPRALLILGKETWPYLGALAPELNVWHKGFPKSEEFTFAKMDHRGIALVPKVVVNGAPLFGATIVVHPSGAKMGGNQAKRSFDGKTGLEAEALTLRRAIGVRSDISQ